MIRTILLILIYFLCFTLLTIFLIFLKNELHINNSETIIFTSSDFSSVSKNFTKLREQLDKALINKVQNVSECGCERKFFYPPSEEFPTIYDSSCSDEGTYYQDAQKVVTFSMHFPNKRETNRHKLYYEGIQQNLEKMKKYYPGYSMRIYTDETLNDEYCPFVCKNPEFFWCDVKESPSLGNQSGILFSTWRFFPLGDPTVDIFLSRDLDSVITEREVAVVQDWLKLDKAIHVMRDKLKAHNIPILAGMWGVRNPLLKNDAPKIREEIIEMSGAKKRYKGLDQSILNKVIFYPRKQDIVAYDSYHCKNWSKHTLVRPFPRKRENAINDFVGNYDLGRKKYELPICPVECRPNYGKDWEYC